MIVTGPDGKQYELPDAATDEQIKKFFTNSAQPKKKTMSVGESFGNIADVEGAASNIPISSIGRGFMRTGAQIADTAVALADAISQITPGGRLARKLKIAPKQDTVQKFRDDVTRDAIKYWTKDKTNPYERAGELVGGLGMFAATGPAAIPVMAGVATNQTGESLIEQGVPLREAQAAATVQGATAAALGAVPMVGKTGARTAGIVAASPVAGGASDAITQAIISDPEVAKQFDPFDIERRLTDLVTAGAFSTIGHIAQVKQMKRQAKEAARMPEIPKEVRKYRAQQVRRLDKYIREQEKLAAQPKTHPEIPQIQRDVRAEARRKGETAPVELFDTTKPADEYSSVEEMDKSIQLNEALRQDETELANQMAFGRENPLVTNILSSRSKDLQNLEAQEPGTFNHDNVDGATVVKPADNIEVAPSVKPVIKATRAQMMELRAEGKIGPETHTTMAGPEGTDSIYIISKEGAAQRGVDVEQIKKDLAEGKESEHLGMPERSPDIRENKTAAVTKDNTILTNPEEIKQASAEGALKWAAEGRPDEVLAKAEEVAKASEDRVANNGSGESAASLEAQSRLKSQQGKRFYSVTKSGKVTELPATVDRVDIDPPKGGAIYEVDEAIGGARRIAGEHSLSQRQLDNLVDRARQAETERLREADSMVSQRVYTLDEGVDIPQETKASQNEAQAAEQKGMEEAFGGKEDSENIEVPTAADKAVAETVEAMTPEEDAIVYMNLGVNPIQALDSAIEGISKVYGDNTTYAGRNIFRSFRTPQMLAERSPAIKAWYKLSTARHEMRNAILYDLYKEGLEGAQQKVKKLSKEDKAKLDALIDNSDIQDIFYSDKILKRNGYSDEVIFLYKEFKRLADATIQREMLERRNLAAEVFRNTHYYKELVDILINKEIDLEDNPYYLEDTGLAFNKDFINDFNTLKEHIALIDEQEARYANRSFYAPRVREPGDLVVRIAVKSSVPGREPTVVFSRMVKTEREARRLKRKVLRNPEKYFPENYKRSGGNTREYIALDNIESNIIDEDIYLKAGMPAASVAKLSAVVDRLVQRGDIDATTAQRLRESIITRHEEVQSQRGFGRHKIERSDSLIEGYQNHDYFSILTDYMSGMAGSVSKAKYAMDAMKVVAEAPKEIKPFLQSLIQNSLRNRNTSIDAKSATIRSAVTIYHLGKNLMSVIANSTQNMSMGAAEMNARLRRDFQLPSTADIDIPKAQFDIMSVKIRPGSITPAEQAFLDSFSRRGADQAQAVNEMTAFGERGASKTVDTVAQKTMWVFGQIESKFNREALALAMFRRLTKEGVDTKIASEVATEVSNTAHGDMSPENMPLILQGKAEWLTRPMVALRRYPIHVWNYIFNRMGQGEYRAVGRMLVAQTVLGGVKAIPMFAVFNEVAEKYFGKSPLLALKKAIFRTMKETNQTLAQVVDNFIERGLPSLVGVDMNNNLQLSMPFILEDNVDASLWERLGGVIAGDLTNIGRGIDRITSGQTGKGILQMMPTAVRNLGKGILGATEGYVDKKGSALEDKTGKPIILSPLEAARQAVGMTPTRVGEARDMNNSLYNLDVYYKNKMSKFNNRIENAETKEEKDAIQKERQEFNKQFREDYPGMVKAAKRFKGRSDSNMDKRQNFWRNITEGRQKNIRSFAR